MISDYVLANPSGNITALVTAPVAPADRARVVSEIFNNEPTCEQVGFVEFLDENSISLEMMGGEFCGNATISAAAYLAESYNMPVYEDMYVNVHCSGVGAPLSVYVLRKKDSEAEQQSSAARFAVEQHNYVGTVMMPRPELGEFRGYPLVLMDGISHLLVPASEMSRDEAEKLVKEYAAELDVLALGIVLYEEARAGSDNQGARVGAGQLSNRGGAFGAGQGGSRVRIEPLVYVKGSDTLFWENGCATGSTAIGFYRFVKAGVKHSDVLNPGGVITIKILDGVPQLTGNVIF